MILYLFKNFILNKIYLLIENKYYFINKISKIIIYILIINHSIIFLYIIFQNKF